MKKLLGPALALAALAVALAWFLRGGSRPALVPAGEPSAGREARSPGERGDAEKPTDGRASLLPDASDPSGASPGRFALRLELVRWPDGAPLRRACLEVRSGDDSQRAATDGEARCALEFPARPSALHLEVPGFEALDRSLVPDESALRLELRPISGVCGRVVDGADEPVAGARVVAERVFERAMVRELGRGSGSLSVGFPQVRAQLAETRSGPSGWYLLAVPTLGEGPSFEVSAERDGAKSAGVFVPRPRAFEPLAELVLGAAPRISVRVVDEAGRGIPGALVHCDRDARSAAGVETDATGACTVAVNQLPARVHANTRDHRGVVLGLRIDGVDAPIGTPVESTEQRVEIVLREVPVARFRVLERASGAPIAKAQGELSLVDAGGRQVGRNDFETDARGEGATWLVPVSPGQVGSIELGGARVRVRAWQMSWTEATELTVSELSAEVPATIWVERPANARFVRGRVLRDGAPAGGLALALVGLIDDGSGGLRPSSANACTSDEDGRFSALWTPRRADEALVVRPHVAGIDAFGLIGPLTPDEAERGELSLELESGMRAPVVLRGAQSGARYVASIAIETPLGAVPVTINGDPLDFAGAGEVRTWVELPSTRASLVRIGRAGGEALDASLGTSRFDPSAPALPLVFELPPAYARVTGRAQGSADALEGARVVAAPLRDVPDDPRLAGMVERYVDAARWAPVGDDASFAFDGLERGRWELLLVRPDGRVLGRTELTIEGDLEYLVLEARAGETR